MKLPVLALLTSLSASSFAAEFYIDPVNGSPDNDGSKEAPWRTLQEVFENRLIESQRWQLSTDSDPYLVPVNSGAPVKAGDTLILNSGYHGHINEQHYINAEDIVVTAGKGQYPLLSRIRLRHVSHWIFSGLSISPTHAPDQIALNSKLVEVVRSFNQPPSSHIQFLGNDVFSVPDSSTWDGTNWKNDALDGIQVEAVDSTVANNYIYNVGVGIHAGLENNTIFGNTVMNFSGIAGIRALGDHSDISRNLVANGISHNGLGNVVRYGLLCYPNQSDSIINDVTVSGNWFIHDLYHPDPSLISNYRGIGLTGNAHENFLIKNNILQLNQDFGIYIKGSKNSLIINNTLVDADNDGTEEPRISVRSHRSGYIGGDNVVRNNVAHVISIFDEGTSEDHNLLVDHENISTYFTDRENFDLTPAPDSPLIGSGSVHKAPLVDVEGSQRIRRIDIGAHQAKVW